MARSISWETFKKAIRTNSKAILLPSKSSKGAMVYLKEPQHRDSDHRGLWEIMAVPSPTFYPSCDAFDFVDGNDWVRGYRNFFQSARAFRDPNRKPIFQRSEIEQYIPDAYYLTRGTRALKDLAIDRKTTQQYKNALKLKARSKPIAGNGMPLDWVPGSTIYT